MKFPYLVTSLILSGTMISSLHADTNKVQLPEHYASHFVRYTSVDKPAGDRPAKMRYFYVNKESLESAKAGESFAGGHGTDNGRSQNSA